MALREQVARAIATTAQFETASAATKQELADATILHMLLLEAAREQAQRAGAAQQRAVADAARRGAKASFGLDLASMTLTEQGLVPAMEIGSVDSTSGEPKARAAMSEADAGPSQGVIAQAGNKRLGAALLLSKVTGRRE